MVKTALAAGTVKMKAEGSVKLTYHSVDVNHGFSILSDSKSMDSPADANAGYRPDAGRIEVLGVDARSEDDDIRLVIERNTGVLFQDGALFSSLTVGENVQVPLKEHHPDVPDSLRYELAAESEAGGPARRCDREAALAIVRRHAQACGPGARARAGSAAAVPRRTHRGPGPDRCRRVRRTDPHAAARAGAHGVPGHARSRHAVCDLRSRGGDRRPAGGHQCAHRGGGACDHPWVRAYFHGPRARAARGGDMAAMADRRSDGNQGQLRPDRRVHHRDQHLRPAVRPVGRQLVVRARMEELPRRLQRAGDRPVRRRERPLQRHQRGTIARSAWRRTIRAR